jgi:hypothetical protein
MADTTIPLPQLPRELRARGVSIGYGPLWRLVIEGSLPAHRMGARWVVRAADLPAIAELVAQAAR